MYERKTFTEEELSEIRANPYVKSATASTVHFTASFKEEYWRRYTVECQSPCKILKEFGLDPEVLGQKRIDGITRHIREQADSGEGFYDVRKMTERKPMDGDQQLPTSRAILKMQHKIAYMEQELEFIKKTILADRAARRK